MLMAQDYLFLYVAPGMKGLYNPTRGIYLFMCFAFC